MGADAAVHDNEGPAGPEALGPGSHKGRDPPGGAEVEADALYAYDRAHDQYPLYGIEQGLSLAHGLVHLQAEQRARPRGRTWPRVARMSGLASLWTVTMSAPASIKRPSQ